jgi:hypothetical protein
MRQGLMSVFEKVASIKEEYDKLADTDAAGKIATANQALVQFGVQVSDAASADKYMEILDSITQGNTSAMNELVAIAQEQAGLSVKEYGNAYSKGWDNLNEEPIAFFDSMKDAGLGYWELLEND